MAPDSWLAKMKSAISTGIDSVRSTVSPETVIRRRSNIGIRALEVASLMSKLVHTWQSLSDSQISRLRHQTIALEGIRKIVSDDDSFLLGLACAELAETLRLVADAVSVLSKCCADQQLREFDRLFKEFTKSGLDPNRWTMSWKEMDGKAKKMDKYVTSTAALYKDMDELSDAEQGLKKLLQSSQIMKNSSKMAVVADVQQKIFWQRQEVKFLRQTSLWGCTFDTAVSLLVRSTFTILARIKNVFGIGHEAQPPVPRGVPVSAVVYPSSETLSPPLLPTPDHNQCWLFELSSAMVVPPETTLGASALALHYANVITVIEKMIRTPRLVGPDARDELYGMLPATLRGLLRSRLRGVGWGVATDARLAMEWRAAMARIVEWLWPIAQSTVKWQSERSFERRSHAAAPRANVLLLQTLYFANREKVEAAVAELLVGLNYVWRFEMEMCMEL